MLLYKKLINLNAVDEPGYQIILKEMEIITIIQFNLEGYYTKDSQKFWGRFHAKTFRWFY